jgi:hypothetical protein
MKRISIPEGAADVAGPALQGAEMIQIGIGAVIFVGVLFWLVRSFRAGNAATEGNGE